MNSKQKLFWICQCSGWFFVTLINFLIQTFKTNFNWIDELVANTCFFIAGVTATYLLRWTYQKLKVIEVRSLKMIIPVLGLSMLSSLFIVLVVFVFLEFAQTPANETVFTVPMFLGNLIAIYPIVVAWSMIYLAVQSLFRWRQSEFDKLALETALKDAQLNMLIGQLNPHFMFNALNNIRGLMLEDIEKARRSLTQLATVLRYSLTAPDKKLIPLSDELSVIEDFIALAKIHLETRLNWQKDIQDTSKGIMVPPMLIQILIENAIKHGISEVKGGGTLSLTIKPVDGKLLILVENSGQLEQPRDVFASTKLGLANIQQRLELLYGDEASFSITQQEDKVTARLLLPKRSSL